MASAIAVCNLVKTAIKEYTKTVSKLSVLPLIKLLTKVTKAAAALKTLWGGSSTIDAKSSILYNSNLIQEWSLSNIITRKEYIVPSTQVQTVSGRHLAQPVLSEMSLAQRLVQCMLFGFAAA
jgi:hypothetical protein